MLGTPKNTMRKEKERKKERERERQTNYERNHNRHTCTAGDVGLTIRLPPPHLHLLLGSYGRVDARELHMPMAFLRNKPPKAPLLPPTSIDPESRKVRFYPIHSYTPFYVLYILKKERNRPIREGTN